jgi:2'-5' RNA ligase
VHRTFLAIDLDEPMRQRLAGCIDALSDLPGRVRWVRRANLHVTLKFIGDIPDDALAALCETAGEVADGLDGPIPLAVARLSAIPPWHARRPSRMIWADVDDPTGQLGSLHDQLESALRPLGFPAEKRPFRPHISLGRIKSLSDQRQWEQRLAEVETESCDGFHGEGVSVYTSELTRAGPIYTRAAWAGFGGGDQ